LEDEAADGSGRRLLLEQLRIVDDADAGQVGRPVEPLELVLDGLDCETAGLT
jgi:hypothetical protein